jgi:hypothetical protein
MRLVDLLALYLIAGTACAVALYRRETPRGRAQLLSALAAVPLWPLWAPIAWTSRREATRPQLQAGDRLQAIRAALDEVIASVAGTPLERLLDRDAVHTIVEEAERVSARNAELVSLLAREEFQLERAEAEIEALERSPASPRVRASARLHLENVRRLHQFAARDRAALDELVALVSALRTELMLVRLAGASAEGVDDIVGDLWAHIEGLRRASSEVLSSQNTTA